MGNNMNIDLNEIDDNCLTIAVTSGKGGVGKSNIVTNLAIQFGLLGKKVMVLDADLGMANLDVLFGVRPKYTLYHCLEGRKDLLEVITSVNQNVKLIAGGSGISDLAELDEKSRTSFLQSLQKIRQYTDILIIDTGAGISSNVISFLSYADEVLLVSTPEPTSMADAYGIIKTLGKTGKDLPKIGILVNRSNTPMEAYEVSTKLTTLAEKFLNLKIAYKGYILEDEFIQKSVRSQRPLLSIYPESKAAICIRKLADSWVNVNKTHQPKSKMGFFQSILSLFSRKK
ncbi:MAG: ATP-binding protein [Candidatus Cloacimonadota bacterium]|nr:MAG: ATP-binding protein [Candidatus Cloacimonadota bacterium]